MKNILTGATLFLGGAIVGAAAIILLAPKVGEEVKQKITDLIDKAKQEQDGE